MQRNLLLNTAALAVVACLVLRPGLADDKKDAVKLDDKAKAELEAYLKYASPGPEHKRLEPLNGSWTFTAKMWMDPAQKEPTESKGTADRKWVLGGRFLQEEIKGEFMGQPFQGFGLTGYDNGQKKYIGTWGDTMATGLSNSSGTSDEAGKVFTFTREDFDPVSKKTIKGRDLVRILGDDKHTMEMYKTGPDGKEMKVLELVFTRKGK